MKSETSFDCLIVGGGLAGPLLFCALKAQNPSARVLLIERGSLIGGNHTWCFHESDIAWAQSPWIRKLISKSWQGYDVLFPQYKRTIDTAYHAIKSQDLHRLLVEQYADDILLEMRVESLNSSSVTLASGETLKASCVVDARGWGEVTRPVGYQKFVGLDLKLKKNHGRDRVLLKDVLIPQIDGYRFIYILPWSDNELLIEDTYYSESPELDQEVIQERILSYAQTAGFEVEQILRVESGCLPLVDHSAHQADDVLRLGASSLEYQPVTGYSFPQTFCRVVALAQLNHFNHQQWQQVLAQHAGVDRRQRRYFHLLNKMLFLAARPCERYLVLQRFYQLPAPLIERFYQGRLKFADQLRILVGRPPVPLWRAIKSLLGH